MQDSPAGREELTGTRLPQGEGEIAPTTPTAPGRSRGLHRRRAGPFRAAALRVMLRGDGALGALGSPVQTSLLVAAPVPPGTALGSAARDRLGVLRILLCCCLMPSLPSGLTALLPFNSSLSQLIRMWGEVRATSRGWTNPIMPMSSAGPRGQGG